MVTGINTALSREDYVHEIVPTVALGECSCDDDFNVASILFRSTSCAVNTATAAAACCEHVSQRQEPCQVVDFINVTVPAYSDVEFKLHFRMYRSTFEVNSGV